MDSPTAAGGNTNSGPLADDLFSPDNRDIISEVILDVRDRDNFKILLSLFHVMIRISQSTDENRRVNIDAVKELGIELMIHLKTSFRDENGNPWVSIINSVHQMCGHCWEMFRMNDGLSISMWSENPLESWNKHVRSFQSGTAARARQMSVKQNIHDIFRRMLIMSHPYIVAVKLKCLMSKNTVLRKRRLKFSIFHNISN